MRHNLAEPFHYPPLDIKTRSTHAETKFLRENGLSKTMLVVSWKKYKNNTFKFRMSRPCGNCIMILQHALTVSDLDDVKIIWSTGLEMIPFAWEWLSEMPNLGVSRGDLRCSPCATQ